MLNSIGCFSSSISTESRYISPPTTGGRRSASRPPARWPAAVVGDDQLVDVRVVVVAVVLAGNHREGHAHADAAFGQAVAVAELGEERHRCS